jgi:hypothetical protein
MPRIICHYEVCVYNKDSLCTSKAIEYDPDQGCLTAQDRNEFVGLLEGEDEFDEEDEDAVDGVADEDELGDNDDESLDDELEEDLDDEDDEF